MKTLSQTELSVIEYLKNHFIEFKYSFVPFSLSRNRTEKNPSFNYLVSFTRGKKSFSTDYMKGMGHCEVKLYPDSSKPHPTRIQAAKLAIVRQLCETGKKPISFDCSKAVIHYPNAAEVLYSLLLDANCGNYRFDEFCREYGYDEDSREAYRTWEACQKIAHDVESLFTANEIAELNDLLQDY